MNNNSVFTIPENHLYEFDNNRYVWRIKLNATRCGYYTAKVPFELTEVYEKDVDSLKCLASGRLLDNKNNLGEEKFSIFDFDQDDTFNFEVTKPLTEVGKEELLMLKKNISRLNKKRRK